jgi:hypothetical protein
VGLILNQNAGALRRAILHEEELRGLKIRVESEAGFGGLIGKDPHMQLIYQLIQDGKRWWARISGPTWFTC